MDDLVRICRELTRRKERKKFEGEIPCTRKVVKRYVNGDYDKLLYLKAHIEVEKNSDSRYRQIKSDVLIVYSVLVSVGAVARFDLGFYLLILLALLISILPEISKKTDVKRRWMPYISVIIEEMEKDTQSWKKKAEKK